MGIITKLGLKPNKDAFILVPGNEKCDSFYISKYEISKEKPVAGVNRKLCYRGKKVVYGSIPGNIPLTKVGFEEAMQIAKTLGGTLPTSEQYDRVNEWLIETGAVTPKEVYEDSTMCGNYYNNPNGLKGYFAATGSNPDWCHNGIDNWFGNTYCWTIDEDSINGFSIRGGSTGCYGESNPVASYFNMNQYNPNYSGITLGFRVVYDKKCLEMENLALASA